MEAKYLEKPCPVFHAIVPIKNDGHYFAGTEACCTGGLDVTLTAITTLLVIKRVFWLPLRAMLRWARKQGVKVGIFCALHTYSRLLNQHPRIHLSVTRGGLTVKHGVWRDIFLRSTPWRKSGAVRSPGSCAKVMTWLTPAACLGWGISAIKDSGSAICRRSPDADGSSILQRRPAEPSEASNTSVVT